MLFVINVIDDKTRAQTAVGKPPKRVRVTFPSSNTRVVMTQGTSMCQSYNSYLLRTFTKTQSSTGWGCQTRS